MEWQPIETAPLNKLCLISDGEEVLLSAHGKVSHIPLFGWLNLMCDAEDIDLTHMQPTHWMPLPTPPKVTA